MDSLLFTIGRDKNHVLLKLNFYNPMNQSARPVVSTTASKIGFTIWPILCRNWEVLIVTYEGKLRGYLVSQTDGFKLHHKFHLDGGVGALAYSASHSLLYVAGLPRSSIKVTLLCFRLMLSARIGLKTNEYELHTHYFLYALHSSIHKNIQ